MLEGNGIPFGNENFSSHFAELEGVFSTHFKALLGIAIQGFVVFDLFAEESLILSQLHLGSPYFWNVTVVPFFFSPQTDVPVLVNEINGCCKSKRKGCHLESLILTAKL